MDGYPVRQKWREYVLTALPEIIRTMPNASFDRWANDADLLAAELIRLEGERFDKKEKSGDTGQS